ncbi:signal sequence receptor alpha chain [Histoplasma capsulatum G186AR]|uniref:Signal sequence receptor alpha chain n=2 Tax=Ajellomyces capsulatus TaxID=5037 RepID=C0NWI9_AJECG|nr:signal sequence receptor alpha chain [Histoplasma capsulatum G186AR]EEH04294.1 signal sequence receptor alpha chain [Histoplasma capsulatum G186AR]KAG5291252.1 signal sequence receptor alpha chain [Histoplasma capsulatum]QSS68555.1 signal sequence receptor alpha chain [Histoplasma capsulatum G186AR]
MGKYGLLSVALLSLQALLVRGDSPAPGDIKAPELDVTVSASFPNSEVFGVKLVNGNPTNALLSISNNEPDPVTLNLIGGSLWTIHPSEEVGQNVRNLTSSRYNIAIPPGGQHSMEYPLVTEMHPQDLRLHLAAVISNSKGMAFTVRAYNGTVSIVEAETSIFDPKVLFLYFFLLSAFVGTVYFFYTIWIAPYFPQKRKGADRPKKSSGRTKSEPSEQASVSGTESTGVTSGKTYDTEWIPAHHIHRPEPRKVKSGGRAKPKA